MFHCSSGDRKTKCQHKFDKSLKMSELKKRQQCSCRLQQREKKNNGLVWITETEWGTSNLLRLTKYRTAWYFLITSREKRKMRNRISVNESVWGFYHSVTVLAHWTINENSDWGNITATSKLHEVGQSAQLWSFLYAQFYRYGLNDLKQPFLIVQIC